MMQVEEFKVKELLVSYRGRAKKSGKVTGFGDAAPILSKLIPDNSREHFIALYLDGSHQPLSYRIFSGSRNSCQVDPVVILQGAILVGAVSVIVAHNHPSGDLTPSEEDIKVTRRLQDAGKVLGVSLLDHIIIGHRGESRSLNDHGYL